MKSLFVSFLLYVPFIVIALILKFYGITSPYVVELLIAGIFIVGAMERRRHLRR
ncbi:hypothetical protein C7438_1285 [Brockia lithotrophica]|uniref:Uncharacterized protein n=1 Tax=Brockia lithotrophica TaxID=933949 RepID=A0A660KVG7_9BACL|nr:hypothetical protein C7438_1285 [Brockia lithotrophica]